MKQLTLSDAISITGGCYYGDSAKLQDCITGSSSDSRNIAEGTLFVAYRGARVDGHDFIADCLKRGASCALSERMPKDASETPCIVVNSTQAAAAALAAAYRQRFDIPVVGVTGSVGKTTAKEMIWAVLCQNFVTHKNRMNFNNEISLPLMLLDMPENAQAAVMEMGINHFGEMTRLASMVRPNIAVMTNVGDSHLEALIDHAGVLRAKSEVFGFMQGEGLAILNGDDETLKNYACPVKALRFGLEAGNDFRAEEIENLGDEGMSMTLCHHGARTKVHIPAFGVHMVYAALMGAAVGWALGMKDEDIARGIAQYETVGNRARLIQAQGFTIFSDCYNANPNSTASALDSLVTLSGRHVCILGDMLELGPDSDKLHFQTGAHAAKRGVQMIISCGELSRNTHQGAAANGGNALHFDDKQELIAQLHQLIRPGDCVLVKASHSRKFEEIVDALMALTKD